MVGDLYQIKKEENEQFVKNEVDTFTLDKDSYLRELKSECDVYNSIKLEADIQQYDNTSYAINYEDFKLTNEEICIKPDSSVVDGCVLPSDNPHALPELRKEYQEYLQTMNNKQNEISRLFLEMSYSCTQCDFKTKYKRSLQTHQLTHKSISNIVIYACNDCPYTTKYKNNLGYHSLIHLSEDQVTMYNCEKCNYKTKRKGHLNSHMRVHLENVSLFHCDKCNYKTKHRGCLKKHVVSHLKIEEADKVYQCTYCSHKTKNKTRLIKHEKIHLRPMKNCDFKCYHCLYQTNNKYVLANHLKTHRQQKLNCEYCSYETVREDRLIAHKKIHINAI